MWCFILFFVWCAREGTVQMLLPWGSCLGCFCLGCSCLSCLLLLPQSLLPRESGQQVQRPQSAYNDPCPCNASFAAVENGWQPDFHKVRCAFSGPNQLIWTRPPTPVLHASLCLHGLGRVDTHSRHISTEHPCSARSNDGPRSPKLSSCGTRDLGFDTTLTRQPKTIRSSAEGQQPRTKCS